MARRMETTLDSTSSLASASSSRAGGRASQAWPPAVRMLVHLILLEGYFGLELSF